MWGFCGILNIYSKQDPCIMSFLFNFLNNLEHSFGWNILKVIVFKCICFIHVLLLHIVVWRVICYSWRYDFLLFLRIASINFFYVFQKNSLGEFVHNYIPCLRSIWVSDTILNTLLFSLEWRSRRWCPPQSYDSFYLGGNNLKDYVDCSYHGITNTKPFFKMPIFSISI
mgnify:CR=1 FL=1